MALVPLTQFRSWTSESAGATGAPPTVPSGPTEERVATGPALTVTAPPAPPAARLPRLIPLSAFRSPSIGFPIPQPVPTTRPAGVTSQAEMPEPISSGVRAAAIGSGLSRGTGTALSLVEAARAERARQAGTAVEPIAGDLGNALEAAAALLALPATLGGRGSDASKALGTASALTSLANVASRVRSLAEPLGLTGTGKFLGPAGAILGLGTGALNIAEGGNIPIAMATMTPSALALAAQFLPALAGAGPAGAVFAAIPALISLLQGQDRPSAQKRWEAHAMGSRAGLVDALLPANSLDEVAGAINRIAGRQYTGADLANPEVLRRELAGSLFDRSAGTSLPNLAMAELARAVSRASPEAGTTIRSLIPPDVRLRHLDFPVPFYAEGVHPEQAQALANARGVTVTTPEGVFSPAVSKENFAAARAIQALTREVTDWPPGWGPGMEAQWAMANTAPPPSHVEYPTVAEVLAYTPPPPLTPEERFFQEQMLANASLAGGAQL